MLSISPSELVSRRSRLFESVSVCAHALIKVVAMFLFLFCLFIYIYSVYMYIYTCFLLQITYC